MSFTKFTNLDYDQIRQSIKDYLRANSDFTDFDFDGSNFSVLIDTLAYNAYINSVNANMIVNESFLDSATVRKNVASLAGNIGYLPRSKKAASAKVYFTVTTSSDTPTLTLKAGLVAVGQYDGSDYVFSIPEDITTTVDETGKAQFGTVDEPIEVYQGTYLQTEFTYDGSLDQRFIINNSSMDYSTLIVRVKDLNDAGLGQKWNRVSNIVHKSFLTITETITFKVKGSVIRRPNVFIWIENGEVEENYKKLWYVNSVNHVFASGKYTTEIVATKLFGDTSYDAILANELQNPSPSEIYDDGIRNPSDGLGIVA